jgi:hypothetical protein
MDVHIPAAISAQLRIRGVDVLTAVEEKTNRMSDAGLLKLATDLNRVVVTHDIRFRARAEDWQRTRQEFAGLFYGHAEHTSIGQFVRDLELICRASEQNEWRNTVLYLPL